MKKFPYLDNNYLPDLTQRKQVQKNKLKHIYIRKILQLPIFSVFELESLDFGGHQYEEPFTYSKYFVPVLNIYYSSRNYENFRRIS